MPTPVHSLPEGYQEVMHVRLLEDETVMAQLVKMSWWALVISIAGVLAWRAVILEVRGTNPDDAPTLLLWVLAIAVLFIHEWLHGVAIRWAGQRPRYGMITQDVNGWRVPMAFYATTDGGLFQRNSFIVIALTPLVVITAGCMALMWLLPDAGHFPLGVMLIVNATGAVGDIWMTQVILRYPLTALVKDEADAIRVYVAG